MKIRRCIVALLSVVLLGFGIAHAPTAGANPLDDARVDVTASNGPYVCVAIPIVYIGICY